MSLKPYDRMKYQCTPIETPALSSSSKNSSLRLFLLRAAFSSPDGRGGLRACDPSGPQPQPGSSRNRKRVFHDTPRLLPQRFVDAGLLVSSSLENPRFSMSCTAAALSLPQ